MIYKWLNLNDMAIDAILGQNNAKFNGIKLTAFPIRSFNGLSLPVIVDEANNKLIFRNPIDIGVIWTDEYNKQHKADVSRNQEYGLLRFLPFVSMTPRFQTVF